MFLEYDAANFLKVGHFFEEKIDIELFLTLFSASMILFHAFPIKDDSELGHENKEQISQENYEVKIL